MVDLSLMSVSYTFYANSIFLHHSSSILIICGLQDKNGSAVRRKAIADYGLSHDTSENAVSGLSDDTVKGSKNQTRHISHDRINEVPLLTTEVRYPSSL
jgi:hypothetical protein